MPTSRICKARTRCWPSTTRYFPLPMGTTVAASASGQLHSWEMRSTTSVFMARWGSLSMTSFRTGMWCIRRGSGGSAPVDGVEAGTALMAGSPWLKG